MIDTGHVPDGVDITRPSPARLYDYFLGGTANYEVDRKAAEKMLEDMPEVTDAVWANRGFLQRAARWLAEHGIRQYVDVGAGLPTQNNTHDAVRGVMPDARIVYVDNDPLVEVHARHLLRGIDGVTIVQGDLCEPEKIYAEPRLRELIDFDEPVGLLVVAVLHFVPESADPYGCVARLMEPLPPGSYLVLSHATYEKQGDRPLAAIEETYSQATAQAHLRNRRQVERFFEGLEYEAPYPGAPPMLVYGGLWGAEDPETADSDGSRWLYEGVARKVR